ncbi:hypothetical protein ASZ90_011040 [hydrocarbon metagenome]|uniref:Uncharacterized protein n=1 Tax=hydrocarbon metagenome TaxID=938273 RepID=A0A0W8FED5_9ZZZZ
MDRKKHLHGGGDGASGRPPAFIIPIRRFAASCEAMPVLDARTISRGQLPPMLWLTATR